MQCVMCKVNSKYSGTRMEWVGLEKCNDSDATCRAQVSESVYVINADSEMMSLNHRLFYVYCWSTDTRETLFRIGTYSAGNCCYREWLTVGTSKALQQHCLLLSVTIISVRWSAFGQFSLYLLLTLRESAACLFWL